MTIGEITVNILYQYAGSYIGPGTVHHLHNDESDCYQALKDNREQFVSELQGVKRASTEHNINHELLILNCDSCHMNDLLYFAEINQRPEIAKATLEAYANCVAEVYPETQCELLFYGNPRHPDLTQTQNKNTVYHQIEFMESALPNLPDNINIRFVSGCALNYDNIERNVKWNPLGGICHMMGKPKQERVAIVTSLIDNPDFQFTMAHPDWSQGSEYELTDQNLIKYAQVDPNIKLDATIGLPNGYQTPEFLYNQSCVEVTVETMPMCGASYLTEKTWRGWIEGMPWFGTEYEELNAHSMGMISYFSLTDSQTQSEASVEFMNKLRTEPDFVDRVKTIQRHNQQLAQEYLDLMRIELPQGDHEFHYAESIAMPSIIKSDPGVNIKHISYTPGKGI